MFFPRRHGRLRRAQAILIALATIIAGAFLFHNRVIFVILPAYGNTEFYFRPGNEVEDEGRA